MTDSNPFAALQNATNSHSKDENHVTEKMVREKLELSYCYERVFLVSLDKDLSDVDVHRPNSLVFLEDLHNTLDQQEWLDIENISQAMFERTLMSSKQLRKSVVKATADSAVDHNVIEDQTLVYLCNCYIRASKERNQVNAQNCKDVITENASTCLRQPDLYEGQNIEEQMCTIFFTEFFSADSEHMLNFLEKSFNKVLESEDFLTLCSLLHPILSKLHRACTRGLLGKLCDDSDASNALKIIHFFARNQNLAEVLLGYTNTTSSSARAFEKSLFGTILSSSCAPGHYREGAANDLFINPDKMTQADVDRAEAMAYSNSSMITSCMHNLFNKIFRLSPRTKHLLLNWIGRLIAANSGRVQLASTMAMDGAPPRDECSDGLMLNLCNVLVRMCEPFCKPKSSLLLKLRPQYCRQQFKEANDQEQRHHHCLGLPDETFLISLEENEVEELEMPTEYGFVCDVFFLTQQALYLGVHGTKEKFLNLNRELNRIQSRYQQVQNNPAAPNAEAIKFAFERAMKAYMAIRTAMIDPELLKPILRFHIASATYLSYLATGGDNVSQFSPLTFPLTACNTRLLGCMPEFVINNITDAMVITRRFKSVYLQDVLEFGGHFMDLILVFMGSKSRLKNPHLRAKLAEVLYEMMPNEDNNATGRDIVQEMVKRDLFTSHPNIDNLAEVLFTVFVSIETTGESVQFEQKLNYRQPMYKVIDYIWKIDLHQKAIVRLADVAFKDIENTDAPLFLKFVNLLVNDAIFLLGEALDLMKQLKEKEQENQESAATMSQREMQQREANMSHMAQFARFHNSAAVDTIHTLSLLTSECSKLFCHSVMVDRIASMLNYFLRELTGPQMGAFKVKEFAKYEFKPAVVVAEISDIYLNLAHSESFCEAVSGDGRSYSPKLFPQTVTVLNKIHHPFDKIQQFTELGHTIENAAAKHLEDDDLVASAPEEFLDPLLGTLMKDPVILPSSKNVVDKSTIARHLLSDQIDPFNRNPLALDQVIPDSQLKSRINEWIAEQRKAKLS